MHLHLDPVGGIAGDMFVAALLDLRPSLVSDCLAVLRAAGAPPSLEVGLVEGTSGGITGKRFRVQGGGDVVEGGRWREIDELLARAAIPAAVRDRARSILALLAETEAAVHGASIEHVHFHELAGWDSFVDILAAAFLIESLQPADWSVEPLPLGGGRVRTAHGFLPVPAPATARLLEGFVVQDDGIGGERVTPTGAAILRHLGPSNAGPGLARMVGSGHGLGSRELPGLPNMLRVTEFAMVEAVSAPELVGVIRFEIDDQTPEDLALALDRLRDQPEVLDVVQWPVAGKRGRLATAVQILTEAGASDAVVAACLTETSTIGCRIRTEQRRVLQREAALVTTDHGALRVKRTRRPDGSVTTKVESQDLAGTGLDYASRSRLRRLVERE